LLGGLVLAVPEGDLDRAALRGVGAVVVAAAACRDDGCQHGEGDDEQALHDRTSRAAPSRTTERARLRGRSGSSPFPCASAVAVRWARTRAASASSGSQTRVVPVARISCASAGSRGSRDQTTVLGLAIAIGPWRYSRAG